MNHWKTFFRIWRMSMLRIFAVPMRTGRNLPTETLTIAALLECSETLVMKEPSRLSSSEAIIPRTGRGAIASF